MADLLIAAGIIWLVWQVCKEKSWETNAYDNSEIDYTEYFRDLNVNVTLGKMTKADVKRKFKNGGYRKK